LTKNGQFINPQKKVFSTCQPIGQKEMEAFGEKRDEVMAWLKDESSFKKRLNESSEEF
jgi:hypothetical protein